MVIDAHEWNSTFKCKQHTMHGSRGPEKHNYTISCPDNKPHYKQNTNVRYVLNIKVISHQYQYTKFNNVYNIQFFNDVRVMQ